MVDACKAQEHLSAVPTPPPRISMSLLFMKSSANVSSPENMALWFVRSHVHTRTYYLQIICGCVTQVSLDSIDTPRAAVPPRRASSHGTPELHCRSRDGEVLRQELAGLPSPYAYTTRLGMLSRSLLRRFLSFFHRYVWNLDVFEVVLTDLSQRHGILRAGGASSAWISCPMVHTRSPSDLRRRPQNQPLSGTTRKLAVTYRFHPSGQIVRHQ